MKGKEQRLPDYLGHMVEAIDRIGAYVGPMDKAGFVANMLVIDAVIRNIEVIGEASNKVRKHHRAFADEHPEVPWQGCYEMRSVVAHDYFKVDLDIVWETIKNDLPGMRRDVQALLDRLAREQGAAAPSSQGTGD
ncbi:HepT-like ribonuclease domain-containing protein [Burkholderia sp. PU8-34]